MFIQLGTAATTRYKGISNSSINDEVKDLDSMLLLAVSETVQNILEKFVFRLYGVK